MVSSNRQVEANVPVFLRLSHLSWRVSFSTLARASRLRRGGRQHGRALIPAAPHSAARDQKIEEERKARAALEAEVKSQREELNKLKEELKRLRERLGE